MDGKEIGGILRGLMYVGKALLFLLKIAWFMGLYWLLLPIVSMLAYEGITGNIIRVGSTLDKAFAGMLYACFIPAGLTFLQNIIRTVKKDRTFSIWKSFGGRKKKGFEAKLGNDAVALKNAGNVTGFVFGKKNGKYVTMPETTDGHVLVVGGAGSGKTAGIAIPTLMSWQSRVFAIDIKGELYEKTKNARNEAQIKVFNPTDPYNSWGYDPFYMLKYTGEVPEEARSLALSICPLPAEVKDPFWIKSAQNMLTGFLVYFYNKGFSFAETMKEIKSRGVNKLIEEIMESHDEEAIVEVSQFDGMDSKTLSGVFTELSNHITVFATSKELQRALGNDGRTITPQDLENGYDIYCCIPEHKLEQWKDLMGMLCNQFLKAFERRPDGNNAPILFLVDEFPRLGKIETISNGLATLRSKKIHIALFVQSKSQLNAIYGKDVAEVITDNCSYKAILKASEPNTQEWCSKLVGTYDKYKNTSSYNADIIGIGKGQGTSKTTEEKKIIKPEEFAYLQDVVCVFPTGYRRIEKAFYFKDKNFSKQ